MKIIRIHKGRLADQFFIDGQEVPVSVLVEKMALYIGCVVTKTGEGENKSSSLPSVTHRSGKGFARLKDSEVAWLDGLAKEVDASWDELNGWEHRFVEDILERFRQYRELSLLTVPQWESLDRVAEKIGYAGVKR